MVRPAHVLIWSSVCLAVAAAVVVLAPADFGDPGRRPARPGAVGGATPGETAQRYVAALNGRDRDTLLRLSVVDTSAARSNVADRLLRDGGRNIRIDTVAVHPGVANYQATADIAGDASGNSYRARLELTERDDAWLIIYTHET